MSLVAGDVLEPSNQAGNAQERQSPGRGGGGDAWWEESQAFDVLTCCRTRKWTPDRPDSFSILGFSIDQHCQHRSIEYRVDCRVDRVGGFNGPSAYVYAPKRKSVAKNPSLSLRSYSDAHTSRHCLHSFSDLTHSDNCLEVSRGFSSPPISRIYPI